MKKLLLITVSLFISCFAQSQLPIQKKASIKKIPNTIDLNTKKTYDFVNKHYIIFKVNGWIYMISYEPIEGSKINRRNVEARDAYLYRRKLNKNNKWELADSRAVFGHFRSKSNENYLIYDDRSKNNVIEKVHTDNGTCIVMFINTLFVSGGQANQTQTKILFFYPIRKNSDGSIKYGHTSRNIKNCGELEYSCKFRQIKLKNKKGNMFYVLSDSGDKLKIGFDYKHDYKINEGRLMPQIKIYQIYE